MKTIATWVKDAFVKFVDPEHEERVRQVESVLKRALRDAVKSRRKSFVLSDVLSGLEYSTKDLEIARERVFRQMLTQRWQDEQLTEREQELIQWVARRLEIPTDTVAGVNLEFAREYFATALAEAMEDGVLEVPEEQRLQRIASSVGMSMPQFVRAFFRNQGESFLRGMFLSCVEDSYMLQQEWDALLLTTRKLGLTRDELCHAVQPQAHQFVEHVLADAKSDGRLSQREDETLRWLLDNLGLRRKFRRYVAKEVSELRLLTEIEVGRLPTILCPSGIETRAGEIVHYHDRAIWRNTRMLKSGPRSDEHHGHITLTDNRLIFSSPTKSQSVKYRKIVSHRGTQDRIDLQVEGKPMSTYFLHEPSPIPYAMFQKAVSMANQTSVAHVEGSPTRHIPRDIRQRVWQRYGGRCAECGATDYLEFDHIIPVAKGGSNSDTNVQLLCRRCNLKKSDHI